MFRRRVLQSCACVVLWLGFTPAAAVARSDGAAADARIAAHLSSLGTTLDGRAVEALESIDGLGRRLLATRSYLRVGAAFDERWSWSQAEIERFEGSALHRALEAEVARVRAVFQSHNPGYTLWVNPQVRSVELQIERWNENPTVAAAAATMLAHVRQAVTSPDAPEPSSGAAAREWFSSLLRSARPSPIPTLAAPGLSRHGRMQAVDFQVKRGDRTIAGPSYGDVAPIWEGQGWAYRLARAVHAASDRFNGPLATPNEPWHYEYEPPERLVRDEREK
jgi:hypothetical protein